MNDLTNFPPSKPTSPELSPALRQLLGDEVEFDRSVNAIADDPRLLAEARGHLPALRASATWPAAQSDVMEIIGKRLPIYPQSERSDAEWTAWWDDYFEVLCGIPMVALEGAMKAWVRDPKSEFLPKPGQLRALAMQTPTEAVRHYARAKYAARLAEGVTPGKEYVENGKELVAQLLAEFKAEQHRNAAARPPSRGAHIFRQAKVDETGISAKMRALLNQSKERGAA